MNLTSLTGVHISHDEARELIETVFPNILNQIEYKFQSATLYGVGNVDPEDVNLIVGTYNTDNKVIKIIDTQDHDKMIQTIIHEIGHAIHFQLLQGQKFVFSTNNKSKRAEFNYMEDFAEAFKDCVLHLYHNKEITRRDKQMMSIIKPIQRSGINELT